MQPWTGGAEIGVHVPPGGQLPAQVGYAPPLHGSGGHMHTVPEGNGTAMHVCPSGQSAELQLGYSVSAQGVASTGMQPHVPPPPGKHTSSGAQTPSHAGEPSGPHAVVPAVHWHVPPTSAQIGMSAGQAPRHWPATRPHCARFNVVVVVLLVVLVVGHPVQASQQLGHAAGTPPLSVHALALRRT